MIGWDGGGQGENGGGGGCVVGEKCQRCLGTELPTDPSSVSHVGASQPLLDVVKNAGMAILSAV